VLHVQHLSIENTSMYSIYRRSLKLISLGFNLGFSLVTDKHQNL